MRAFIILIGIVTLGLASASIYEANNVSSVPGAGISLAWLSWLGNEYWGIPLWGYVLGIAAVWFALSKTSFGWVSTTFKFEAGSFWMQLFTSFAVLATFFYLLSKVYPNAPLFQPGEGYGHIALYFLLAGLIALVAANLKGKTWFVNTALVILMFAMVGHRTADLLDPSGKLSAKIASILSFGSSNGPSTQIASTTPGCPGGYEPYPLSTRLLQKVSENDCQVRVQLPSYGGCATTYDKYQRPIGRSCPTGQNVVNGIIYYLMADSGPTEAKITLCPLGSSGRNMGSCN